MKQIKYGDDSHTLRCEYPEAWDAASITGVEISIDTVGGTAILAATAATLYTATTLGSACTHGDEYIELAEGASAPAKGDRLWISSSASGPGEQVIVNYYDSSNRYVFTERELQHSHASGAAVKGQFATYAMDVSDTDTYIKGYEMVVTWDPSTDDFPYTDHYVIAGAAIGAPGFWRDFQAMYPVEYDMRGGRDLVAFESQIRKRFAHELMSRQLNPDRIIDQDKIEPGVVLFARFLMMSGQDQTMYDRAKEEWVEWLKTLAADPIWQDLDQDGDIDSDEEEAHEFEIFEQHV